MAISSSYMMSFVVAQKALKEKEEHVEQLLVERDLERSELARMAARVDEVILILSVVRYDSV